MFMISGTYHVGADTPHWTLTREVLQPVRERSITARIVCVPDLSDERAGRWWWRSKPGSSKQLARISKQGEDRRRSVSLNHWDGLTRFLWPYREHDTRGRRPVRRMCANCHPAPGKADAKLGEVALSATAGSVQKAHRMRDVLAHAASVTGAHAPNRRLACIERSNVS